jgi:hypothetical protein
MWYNITGDLMKYIPKMYQKSIFDISYNKLKEKGIKCLVFDLDNTLGLINQELPSVAVVELFKRLKKDFDLYILSNNSKMERVDKYKDALGCKAQNRALKPFTRGLRKIKEANNYKKSEMAIIGDQLVTDIYAGTRYGIITVLVDPLGEKDLWVTKFNRIKENRKLRKYKKKNVFERGKYYEW